MAHDLTTTPVHLGLGATAHVEPPFTGMDWYAGYVARHADDGDEGRLVSMHHFDEPWGHWEMHPHGSEVVVCTAGRITLIQDHDGTHSTTELGPGEFAVNPPGVWHTATPHGRCTVLFITSGRDTRHRPRT